MSDTCLHVFISNAAICAECGEDRSAALAEHIQMILDRR